MSSGADGTFLVARDRRLSRALQASVESGRLMSRDLVIMLAFTVLVLVIVVWSFVPPHSTTIPSGLPYQSPSWSYWAGTDGVGRDVFSRILVGARLSLLAAGFIIASGIVFGTLVGGIAGYAGRWLDSGLMRITDVFLALPAAVLAIAVAGAFGRSFTITLIAVVVVWWPLYARIVRGEVRATMARPHVEAARLSGRKRHSALLKHVLPASFPPVLVAGSLDVGLVVLTLAGLSFLGLGSPEPAPELGGMTAQGLPDLLTAWWIAILPAAMVFLIVFAANIAGDALRDALQQSYGGRR